MKKIYMGIALVLLALYAGRFWYVNALFPQEEYISAGMREVITNNGLEYNVENLDLISAETYAAKYNNANTFETGETIAVTTLKVKKTNSRSENCLEFCENIEEVSVFIVNFCYNEHF